jgi:archaemetzincin
MLGSNKVFLRILLIIVSLLFSCVQNFDRNESPIGKVAQKDNFTIAVQPLGKMDKHIVEDIISALQSTYGADILLLQQKPMYPQAFVNIKSPGYRADSLLKLLKRDIPA